MSQGSKANGGSMPHYAIVEDASLDEDDRQTTSSSVTGLQRCLLVDSHIKGLGLETKARDVSNGQGRLRTVRHWWLEITSCIMSLLALTAIVLTLYPHQDKPLPQWPYRLSINTLLSIYNVVMKAALAYILAQGLGQLKWSWLQSPRPLNDLVKYDDASRGALGSLLLVSTTHIRHLLSSLGAIIMATLLILDPVTQELVRYYGCTTALNSNIATIPRTHLFTGERVPIGADNMLAITPDIQAAVNAGMFANPSRVQVSCQTGNCTFPTSYSSVGYCSQCRDITEQVTVGHFCGDGEFFTNAGPDGCNATQVSPTKSSLPSGLQLTTILYEGRPNVSTMAFNQDDWTIEILAGQIPFDGLRRGGSADANLTWCENDTTVRCGQHHATACSLYPCVKSYKATVQNGIFDESVVASTPSDQTWGYGGDGGGDEDWGIVDTECLSTNEGRHLMALGYEIDPRSRWLPYNATFPVSDKQEPGAPFPQSLVAHGCLYVFSQAFNFSFQTWCLESYFDGVLTGITGLDDKIADFDGPLNLLSLYDWGNMTFDTVDDTFNNIALSLTTYIRHNGGANNSAPAEGEVLHYATCLGVRWPVIAVPVTLVILTILFFILVLLSTASRDIEIWKSSPLPLLFNGLCYNHADRRPPDLVTQISGRAVPRSVAEMERVSKKMVVKLGDCQRPTGWYEGIRKRDLPPPDEKKEVHGKTW